MESHISFLVKVEGSAHSRHRSPEGVYQLDVMTRSSPVRYMAETIIQSALHHIPFLNEESNKFSIRLFSVQGEEIVSSTSRSFDKSDDVCYCGRVFDYPEILSLQ
jgi:hypothetical protein